MAASENHKEPQGCVHKVFCAWKNNPPERPAKLIIFFVTFAILVGSVTSVIYLFIYLLIYLSGILIQYKNIVHRILTTKY